MEELKQGDCVKFIQTQGLDELPVCTTELYTIHDVEIQIVTLEGIYNPTNPSALYWFSSYRLQKVNEFQERLKQILDE